MKGRYIAASLICTVATVFLFSACGGNQFSKIAGLQPDTAVQSPGNTPSSAAPHESAGVSLPEGYPVELVPIMHDAASGWGMGTGGGFNVSYTTPSAAEEVLRFYSSQFEKYGDALSVSDDEREINLDAQGRSINILIDDSTEYTSLRISISEAAGSSENVTTTEQPAENGETDVIFPSDILPLIDGSTILEQSRQKDESGLSYSATVQVLKTFDETTRFYQKYLNSIPEAYVEISDTEFYGNAIKGNESIEIQIADAGNGECSLIINIYP